MRYQLGPDPPQSGEPPDFCQVPQERSWGAREVGWVWGYCQLGNAILFAHHRYSGKDSLQTAIGSVAILIMKGMGRGWREKTVYMIDLHELL